MQGPLPQCPGWNILDGHCPCNLRPRLVSGEISLPWCSLPRPTSSWLFFHAARDGTSFEKRLLAAPPHPPPVPAISETPAIGGNLCQLLGKGLASKKHHQNTKSPQQFSDYLRADFNTMLHSCRWAGRLTWVMYGSLWSSRTIKGWLLLLL